MKNSIKTYFSSYNTEVRKPVLKWLKQHWKGTICITVIPCLTYLAIWGIWYMTYMGTLQEIYRNIKTKLTKKKETVE